MPTRTRTRPKVGLVRQARPVAGGTGWKRRAPCRDAPAHLFEGPDEFDPDLRDPDEVPAEVVRAARIYCRSCPVRAECAAEADFHKYEGLFGGIFRMHRMQSRTLKVIKIDLLEET